MNDAKAYLVFLLWFLIALPGLPISIPLILLVSSTDKSGPGTSGMLGAAFLIAGTCGILGWLLGLSYLILIYCLAI